jgi:hypothetical protein
VVERLEHFRRQHGERFAPPALLAEMAKAGKRFYPNG